MTETDWKNVNVRVEQWRYQNWDDHVGKEPGDDYESMSQLVRRAVDREVDRLEDDGRESETAQATTVEADMTVVTDDVLPALNRIESQLDRLDDRLSAVEREQTAESRSGADLERIVLELLPSESEMDGLSDAKTVKDLSKMTGVSPDNIGDVLNTLSNRRGQPVVADDRTGEGPEDHSAPLVYYRRD